MSKKKSIQDIKVPRGRFRKALGDLSSLAESIAEHGLLHPVVVTEDGTLIAGRRRLEAVKKLGGGEIAVTVVTPEDARRAEADENMVRADFQISEEVAVNRYFKAIEEKEAKERQGGKGRERSAKLAEQSKGQSRDKAAAYTSLGRTSLKKADAVVTAAEEDPERFAPLVSEMDATGKVDRVYRKLKTAKQEEATAKVETSKPKRKKAIKAGEWWQLGQHLLYCGDTSSSEFIDRVDDCALAFADPPYNANAATWDEGFSWQHDWLQEKAGIVAVTPGISSIFNFARRTEMDYVWSIACWITNGMTRGALGFGNWIYVAVFSSDSIHCNAQDFCKVTIDNASTEETQHKGRKPAGLLVYLVETFTKQDDTIVDPFLGSGTTLLAAEELGRRCVCGEINAEFCSEAIGRWESLTGEKAIKATEYENALS